VQHRVDFLVVWNKPAARTHVLLDLKKRSDGTEFTVLIRQALHGDVFKDFCHGHSGGVSRYDGKKFLDGTQAELKECFIDAGEVIVEGSYGDLGFFGH